MTETATVADTLTAEVVVSNEPNLHVMVDLETWSTHPEGMIISIGACAFDPLSDKIDSTFYVAIDPTSHDCRRRHIDPDTILWWMSPERTYAREQWLKTEKVDLFSALDGLRDWLPSQKVWGNGASFDNVMVARSCAAVDLDPIWPFWNDRCYRTIKNLAPSLKADRLGEHHNALDDAITQAQHMQRVVQLLGIDPQ